MVGLWLPLKLGNSEIFYVGASETHNLILLLIRNKVMYSLPRLALTMMNHNVYVLNF